MIHIAIGTKAQLIKMAPVILLLKKRGINYNLIDLGQHSLISRDLRDEFGLDEPGVTLSRGGNVSTIAQGVRWLAKIFTRSLSSHWIRKNIFLNSGGICLIHGDTVSTLLGLYLAKRGGLKVAHVEAGLRSFCWSEPFPEEIIRIIAMRFSDILFAPSQWAYENLVRMGLGKKAVLLPGNTGHETAMISLSKQVKADLVPSAETPGLQAGDEGLRKFISASGREPRTLVGGAPQITDFCLVTFHRMENIYSRARLVFIIGLIEKISRDLPVVFVQHGSTISQLKKYGLLDRLEKMKNRYYFTILSHGHFIGLLNRCGFVITDGGSIQEESYYLGKPCLLLRKFTERNEGLQENALLSRFEEDKIRHFIGHYPEFTRPAVTCESGLIPAAILDSLEKHV